MASLPRFSPVKVTLSSTLPITGATAVTLGELWPPTRGARQSRESAATRVILKNIRVLTKRRVTFPTPQAGLLPIGLPPKYRSEGAYLRRRYARPISVSSVRLRLPEDA